MLWLTCRTLCTVNCSVPARGAVGRTLIRTLVSANMHSIVFSYLRYQSHIAHQQGRTAQPRHETINANIISHISFLGLSCYSNGLLDCRV